MNLSFTLRGSRICHPRMYHFGKWVISSADNWGPVDSGRAFYLPLNCLKNFIIYKYKNNS